MKVKYNNNDEQIIKGNLFMKDTINDTQYNDIPTDINKHWNTYIIS